jgi:hypothetical protein
VFGATAKSPANCRTATDHADALIDKPLDRNVVDAEQRQQRHRRRRRVRIPGHHVPRMTDAHRRGTWAADAPQSYVSRERAERERDHPRAEEREEPTML